MKNYYPEESFFGKTKFHPFVIIVFGLSLTITFIASIEVVLSKLNEIFLGINYEYYLKVLRSNNIPAAYLNFFLFRITIIQIFGFGLTGWLLAQSASNWKNELYFRPKFISKNILLAGIIMLVAIPFYQIFMLYDNNLSFLGSEQLTRLKDIERQTQNLLNQIMKSNLGLNIILFAVIPAICEEIFFRGFLFQNFKRFMNVWLAIFFSSLIFSILHFQIYGFLVRIVMGAVLAFFFHFSKNIFTSIFAHFVNNIFTTFVTWLALNDYISKEVIQINYQFHYSIVLISVFLSTILIYFFYQSNKNEKFG